MNLPINQIICGDCLEVMKDWPDNCVDTVITDPPYGLEFMGKEWDKIGAKANNPSMKAHKKIIANEPKLGNPWASERTSYGTPKRNPRCRICGKQKFNHPKSRCACELPQWDTESWYYSYKMQEWHEAWTTEALRIAKPGAFLLCFGGTRTFHRLACAIEDAGWLIKDKICWIFGSGFPKSLNCAKAILKMMLKEFLKDDNRCHYTSAGFQSDCQDSCHLCGELLQFFQVIGQDAGRQQVDAPKHNRLSETLEKILKDNEHNDMAFCASLSFRPAKQGYLCHIILRAEQDVQEKGVFPFGPYSEQSTKAESVRAGNPTDKDLSNKCVLSCQVDVGKLEQFCRTYDTVSLPYNHCKIAYHFCKAKMFYGYGSALKPAYEDILVAMKPLDGTFAQNAEKYGVAGLNIDGGRIEYEKGGTIASNPLKRVREGHSLRCNDWLGDASTTKDKADIISSKGRWPANVILDEKAAAMLDEQSGDISGGEERVVKRPRNKGWCNASPGEGVFAKDNYGDFGSTSRFFYCAKASSAERNAGLGGMEKKQLDKSRKPENPGGNNPRNRGARFDTNSHPTVKPLKLMEYLCRLTGTPTGGVVLDCFGGAGTTAMACVNTDRDYVLIEKDTDYCEIACRRVAWAKEQKKARKELFD